MASQALAVKLRCTSWGQVAAIYERDLKRGMLFLKTSASITLGREVRIDLILPSGTVATLEGRVAHMVPPGDRGPGVELVLTKIPPSTLYLIESALEAARPAPDEGPPSEEALAASAERELIEALEEELRGLRGMNPFQVLAVPYDATDEMIRASFVELSKKYHPDRFARFESEHGRKLASEVFMTVRDAYRRVGDAHARALVRGQIGKGPARRDATPVFGVPVSRAATPVQGVPVQQPPSPPAPTRAQRPGTPVQGVPISLPAPRREGTPVHGVPISPPAPRREGTPVQGVPISPPAPRREQRLPDLPVDADPAAPVAPLDIERGPRPLPTRPAPGSPTPTPPPRDSRTRHAPAVIPPQSLPPSGLSMTVPVVTFHRPEGASKLNAEDLFGDMGELPRTSHAAAPVKLEHGAAAHPAAELIDLGRYEEAMAAYDEQLRAHPGDRSARAGRELAFGLKLAAAGDRTGAAQHLEAALEIEPWSERTARELNNIRRSTTDNRKGLLSKLLGKVT